MDYYAIKLLPSIKKGRSVGVWLCEWEGQAATTHTMDNAKRFDSVDEARKWLGRSGESASECRVFRISIDEVF